MCFIIKEYSVKLARRRFTLSYTSYTHKNEKKTYISIRFEFFLLISHDKPFVFLQLRMPERVFLCETQCAKWSGVGDRGKNPDLIAKVHNTRMPACFIQPIEQTVSKTKHNQRIFNSRSWSLMSSCAKIMNIVRQIKVYMHLLDEVFTTTSIVR